MKHFVTYQKMSDKVQEFISQLFSPKMNIINTYWKIEKIKIVGAVLDSPANQQSQFSSNLVKKEFFYVKNVKT